MLASQLMSRVRSAAPRIIKRNIGIAAPVFQKASDPIQQLFVDKIREYKQKSVEGKMLDATPETEKQLAAELEKVAGQYGGGAGVDMTKFPDFKFADAKVDPVSDE